MLDYKENETKLLMNDPRYDLTQYYLVKFANDSFDNKITFWKLFWYLNKVK